MTTLADVIADAKKSEGKTFTMLEVSKHNSQSSCWVVIGGRVFDVTSFVNDHPGGPEILLQRAGAWSTQIVFHPLCESTTSDAG